VNRLSQRTFLRFAVVGTGVAALYFLGYLTLLSLGLAVPLANFLAFVLAVLVQYVGQTAWTFRRPLALPDQISRFAFTISIGLLVSALITGTLGPGLGWSNWISAAVVTVVLPVQNYLFFRIWVFSESNVPVERQ